MTTQWLSAPPTRPLPAPGPPQRLTARRATLTPAPRSAAPAAPPGCLQQQIGHWSAATTAGLASAEWPLRGCMSTCICLPPGTCPDAPTSAHCWAQNLGVGPINMYDRQSGQVASLTLSPLLLLPTCNDGLLRVRGRLVRRRCTAGGDAGALKCDAGRRAVTTLSINSLIGRKLAGRWPGACREQHIQHSVVANTVFVQHLCLSSFECPMQNASA